MVNDEFIIVMLITGYARVSSREQSENSHALEQQQARLLQAGAVEICSDVESGRRDDRKNFKIMMEKVKKGEIKEIVITRLDRLTRSLPTLRKTVDELIKYGVNLRALDDSIDFSTAAGKFHLNMLGALAEMEVDRLSERVKHGWQHLRDRKVAMNPPFGYTKVDDGYLMDHAPFLCIRDTKIEMSKAALAREIVDAFLEKQTLRLALRLINERYGIQTFAHNNTDGRKLGGRVARDIFRFSPGGLRNWLTSPVLCGHTCYLRKKDGQWRDQSEWDIHENTHPTQRLITDYELKTICAILQRNAIVRGYGRAALKYPLSGLIFCGECRSACYSTKGSRGKQPGYNYYFQCKNWRLRACGNKQMVRMEIVESAVISHLIERASNITQLAQTPPEYIELPELQQLRSQLAGLEALGHNPALELAKNDLRSQIRALAERSKTKNVVDEELQQLLLDSFSDPEYWKWIQFGAKKMGEASTQTDHLVTYTQPTDKASPIFSSLPLEGLTSDHKRQIYRDLVKRIMVRDGQVVGVELKV